MTRETVSLEFCTEFNDKKYLSLKRLIPSLKSQNSMKVLLHLEKNLQYALLMGNYDFRYMFSYYCEGILNLRSHPGCLV